MPVGSVARWRVSVSQEHGGGVHVLGVVSERFNDWDGTTRRGCDGNWVVLNDISWACGKQLDSSWEEIFAAGETVSLTLDRCAHTLTVVGSGRIVVFRDLPAGGDLYPALAFTNSEQYSEVLDYFLDSLTPSSSAGGEDAADGKAKVASEVPLYACMVVHAGYLSHSKLNAGLPACHCWRLPTLHATERHDAACTRNPSPSLCAERASAPVSAHAGGSPATPGAAERVSNVRTSLGALALLRSLAAETGEHGLHRHPHQPPPAQAVAVRREPSRCGAR